MRSLNLARTRRALVVFAFSGLLALFVLHLGAPRQGVLLGLSIIWAVALSYGTPRVPEWTPDMPLKQIHAVIRGSRERVRPAHHAMLVAFVALLVIVTCSSFS